MANLPLRDTGHYPWMSLTEVPFPAAADQIDRSRE